MTKKQIKKTIRNFAKKQEKIYCEKTTVRNIPLGVPANHHTHTTNYDGKRITPIAERGRATFLTVKEAA